MPVESLDNVLSEATLEVLSGLTAAVLRQRPWFLGKKRTITGIEVERRRSRCRKRRSHLVLIDSGIR